MSKQITTLFVSGPAGVSRMLGRDQFEQIDQTHVKFDTTRDVRLKSIILNKDYQFSTPVILESLEVRLIESVTATIVDVYGTLETRNVKETILDLEFLEIDRELNTIDEWIKNLLIDRLNESERFEKLVGNIAIVAI